jgi:hypothetical protein
VRTQVTGALATTTEYEESDPPMPPPNATPDDMAALEAQACAATSLCVAGFKVQGIKGTVKGYSSITLPVEFTPRVAGMYGPVQRLAVWQCSAANTMYVSFASCWCA